MVKKYFEKSNYILNKFLIIALNTCYINPEQGTKTYLEKNILRKDLIKIGFPRILY